MKITLEFSTGQELDCRMLEGAMTAMSRCLLNHLSSEDVVSEPTAEGDALEEVSAEAVAPVEEKPLVVQPKARKPRKSTKTEKKEAEPALSAESPADSEGEGEAPQTKQEQSDLPFSEGEETDSKPQSEPAPQPVQQPTAPTMTAAEFRQVIDIDLNGPFIVSKAVIPSMIKKGHGKIINICSMMSELGRETVSAYAAAKGGLKMLTRNICSEYGEYNIQCNGIGPGYIATPQTAPLRERQPDGSRHPFDSFIVAKTPAARWGTPEDLQGPAVFLASEASNFVNGLVLYVDGGILAYIGKQPK